MNCEQNRPRMENEKKGIRRGSDGGNNRGHFLLDKFALVTKCSQSYVVIAVGNIIKRVIVPPKQIFRKRCSKMRFGLIECNE